MNNRQVLNDYINVLQPGVLFARPYEKMCPRPETRLCLQCGSPYTLQTPYELCNPVARDLCDDCLLYTTTTTTTTKKLSGADPDQLRAVKMEDVTQW
jgi:hypothetical protein